MHSFIKKKKKAGTQNTHKKCFAKMTDWQISLLKSRVQVC